MERKFVVYEHVSKSQKRYIGITSQKLEVRWRRGCGYINNPHFYNAIKKYGWDNFEHNILASGITEEEAKKMEIELIKKYNTTNPEYGYNVTRGGDTRKPCSEETKEKIRKKNTGKIVSEETRKKISETQKKKRPKPPMSDKTKEKISQSLLGNKRAIGNQNNVKKIAMCDLEENIIKIFYGANKASEEVKCAPSGINRACKENTKTDGLDKTKYGGVYAGYKWYYLGEDDKIIKNNKGVKINKRNTPIEEYDINGVLIKKFSTIKEATKFYGFPVNGLGAALKDKDKTLYMGSYWVKGSLK